MNADDRVRQRFDRDTAEHEMRVLKDDGLYRHLRCQESGTWIYGFDVVTWPGYLAIVGDCGDYVFSRIRDMFEFFESDHGRINPDYWAQKLQAPRGTDSARSYSHDAFASYVRDWARDACDERWGVHDEIYPSLLIGALEREVVGGYTHSEAEARQRLEDARYDDIDFGDAWEWDLREFDTQFLWCCWGIVWAIKQYRALPVDLTKVPA